MSYSFSKRAATKPELLEKVVAELENIVAQQSIHSADRAQALLTAETFLAIVPEADDTQDYFISMHGSVSWKDGNVVIAASVGVSVSLVVKEAQTA
jgi:hypothetical protein